MQLQKSDCRYQPLFCEENVWHLARQLSDMGNNESDVLFFINQSKTVLLMNQTAFKPTGYGLWDYHVVLRDNRSDVIYDFDSALGFETSATTYFEQTFPTQNQISPEYRTWVRLVAAGDYLAHFWSDRTHMLNQTGQPTAALPDWDPIAGGQPRLALNDLIDVGYHDDRAVAISAARLQADT